MMEAGLLWLAVLAVRSMLCAQLQIQIRGSKIARPALVNGNVCRPAISNVFALPARNQLET